MNNLFFGGVKFEDKYEMLKGETKRMRVLTLDSMKKKQLDYYLAQALHYNQ